MLHENYELGEIRMRNYPAMQVLYIRLTLVPLLLVLIVPVIVLLPQYALHAGNSTGNYTG